jgi:signal transduction histidine kinase
VTPTVRLSLALAGALILGTIVGVGHQPMLSAIAQQRSLCLSDPGGQLSATWCSVLIRYPNRLPGIVVVLVIAGLAALGVLVARWCLRPFGELVGVVERLGPANLGYRLAWGRRQDVLGRLGGALDAMMDRISAGYDSQRRFAANASHELRTPLAVQRTLIEVGLAGPLTGDQLDLLTRQLLATNERNERLIEGLLVLAEAEQAPIGHSPLRLDEVVTSVVDLHQDLAGRAGVTLSATAEPTTVDGELVLVERLVTNLVRNAIAYNLPRGGRAEVRVEPHLVSVSNTGPVVPPESIDALFEPFRRGRQDRLNQTEGAGLGLTISRAIAAAHRATITARPGPEGGLSIRVDFPPSRQARSLRHL